MRRSKNGITMSFCTVRTRARWSIWPALYEVQFVRDRSPVICSYVVPSAEATWAFSRIANASKVRALGEWNVTLCPSRR
jgi:hypothetical protein